MCSEVAVRLLVLNSDGRPNRSGTTARGSKTKMKGRERTYLRGEAVAATARCAVSSVRVRNQTNTSVITSAIELES